jgi:two-component system nitrogen regulation response regulator GlnG
LRERGADILMLWNHWLARLGMPTSPPTQASSVLGKILLAHDWPGNVRELRNAVEHAARSARQVPIEPRHLPESLASNRSTRITHEKSTLTEAVAAWITASWNRPDPPKGLYNEFLRIVEPPLLLAAFHAANENQALLAKRLGLHRTTLRNKLRDLDLIPPAPGESE